MPMAMRAVPINSAPSAPVETADSTSASDSVMGPPKLLPAVAGPEGLDASHGSSGTSDVSKISTEARENAQVDNSKKRKAQSEARQSEVATALTGAVGKRRASPEADVSACNAYASCVISNAYQYSFTGMLDAIKSLQL